MVTGDSRDIARRLLKVAGTTYARSAGITLEETPQPLFQLLMLCSLMSKPISAEIAVAAAKELFKIGLRTPRAVADANRQEMIRAFGRAHFVRYDESTASRLPEMAALANERYQGDLRPCFDKKAIASARRLGLPTDADELAAFAPTASAELAAALIRVSLADDLRKQVTG